jgi:copper chaperone CopZ
MKNLKTNLVSIIFSLLSLSFLSSNAWADIYKYNADVNGMVCAFCAYSVGKNISKLPGVDTNSINVDLKAGHVVFNSQKKVSEAKLTELFSDSGFSLSNITLTKSSKTKIESKGELSLDLKIDAFKTDQFNGVIEAIGNKVANTSASLIIEAPASQEETILKPLLMGRQQVVKVRFVATESDTMHIQIFSH